MRNHLHPRHRAVVGSILAGAIVLAGCGADDDAASDSTPAPSTTASSATTEPPSTEPPTTEPAPPTTVPVEEWSMEAVGPGTFQTAVMEPGFTLTYGDGWIPFMPESKNQLNIEIPESSELGCAQCGLLLGVSVAQADTPADVPASATADGLELSEAEEVEVGGIAGKRYEVTGGEGYIFETEFSAFGVDSAEGPARFTVLKAGGRVIVIHELAMPEAVDTAWPWSDEVIASIEWSTE
jgi:hypothetical protein